MDEGSFDMDVSMLPGVSLATAMEVNQQAASRLKAVPGTGYHRGTNRQTGVALDTRARTRPATVDIQAEERMEA